MIKTIRLGKTRLGTKEYNHSTYEITNDRWYAYHLKLVTAECTPELLEGLEIKPIIKENTIVAFTVIVIH